MVAVAVAMVSLGLTLGSMVMDLLQFSDPNIVPVNLDKRAHYKVGADGKNWTQNS